MIQELLYTSHQGEGLRKGSGGGFCTVLSTNAMAPNLAQALEKLSGYKHPFDAHDSRASKSPVNYRFTALRIGGKNYHIFSRVSDYRAEHTGRTNKLAHHLVADASLRPDCGPAAVLASSLMRKEWDGTTGVVPPLNDNALLLGSANEKPCQSWAKITGDAGWAGFVAEKLFASPDRPISVIFPVGSDPLALVSDLFALIPASLRWEISFSTYFTTLPPGTSCRLRFLMDQTPEADALRRDLRQDTVDLTDTKRALPESSFTEAARVGAPFRMATLGQDRQQTTVMPVARVNLGDELELQPLRVSDDDLVEIPPSISRRSDPPVELPLGRNKSGPPALPSTPDHPREFSKSKKDSKWTRGLLVGLATGLLLGIFGGLGIGKYAFVGEPKSSGPSFAEAKPDEANPTVVRLPRLNPDGVNPTVLGPAASGLETDMRKEDISPRQSTEEPKGDEKTQVVEPETKSLSEPERPAPVTVQAEIPDEIENKSPSIIGISLLPNGLLEEYEQEFSIPNLLKLRIPDALQHNELTIDYDFGASFQVTGDKDLLEKLQHSAYQVRYRDGVEEKTKYFYFPPKSGPPKTPKAIAELNESIGKYSGLWIRIVKPGVSSKGANLGVVIAELEDIGPTSGIEFDRLSELNLTLKILYDDESIGAIELSKPKENKWRFLQVENIQAPKTEITRKLAVWEKNETSPRTWLFDPNTKTLFSQLYGELQAPLNPDLKKTMDLNNLGTLFSKWKKIQDDFSGFETLLKQPVLEVYLPPEYKPGLPERVVFQYSILKP